MIKAVLMDVGKTIVTNRDIDFKRGLKAVYDLDKRADKIDFERFLAVNQSLRRVSFDSVRKINSETRIDGFLATLCEITGINPGLDIDELQWFFQCHLIDEELIDGVTSFLEYVKEKKYPLIAVSNSCMDSKTIARELKEYGILKYFNEVISSADILIRKPRKEIFDYAYGKLLKIDDSIKRSDVIFIGDDYERDIVGSANEGFIPVWLNHKKEERTDNSFSFININSYDELINVLNLIDKKEK